MYTIYREGNFGCSFLDGTIESSGWVSACFFWRHWEIIKEDVITAVKQFFIDGILPEEINDTSIFLIPKGTKPEEIKDFRPISLCNVIYKLISKYIVNRMWVYLNKIISPEQSAFVPTRRITDNAIIAFECVHAIQRGFGNKGDYCAYKLDLSI
jgi:hypothetical protein